MTLRPLALALVASALVNPGAPARAGDAALANALAASGANRAELEKALASAPSEQRRGMEFLVANMPEGDLRALKADFLLKNVALAYQARREVAWGVDVPEEIFLNDVLPYANVDERRDDWRQEFYDLCMPIARACKTPTEAVGRLNAEVFKTLRVRYSTGRKKPNQSPSESIAQGKASCTGLSIVLSDACRSVGIPARLAGTPNWANKRGNHTWVEVWDRGWHFTGACEPDPSGLDRGWFVGDAAQAVEDSPEHAIYAASFRKTGRHFPLVWNLRDRTVPSENVTTRYAKTPESAGSVRLLVRVRDDKQRRVVLPVVVVASGDPASSRLEGRSRGESADLNDILGFRLPRAHAYVIEVAGRKTWVKTADAGAEQIVEVVVPGP